MKFTGERYLPSEGGLIRVEHVHRYTLVQSLVAGKEVLDVACGEGYGSWLLAQSSKSVHGVDVAPEAIQNAREHYRKDNLAFSEGTATELRFPDRSFDVVVSFETIEHLAEQREMLHEIRRVLRSNGMLVISSPNRPVFSSLIVEKNPFHVKELDFGEFDALVRECFGEIAYYGQGILSGSHVQEIGRQTEICGLWCDEGKNIAKGYVGSDAPVYFIAVCAKKGVKLPTLGATILSSHAMENWVYSLVRDMYAKDRTIEEVGRSVEAVVLDRDYRAAGLADALSRLAAHQDRIQALEGDAALLRAESEKREESSREVAAKLERIAVELLARETEIERSKDARIELQRTIESLIVDRDSRLAECRSLGEQIKLAEARHSHEIQVLNSCLQSHQRTIDTLNQANLKADGVIAALTADRDGRLQECGILSERIDRLTAAHGAEIQSLGQNVRRHLEEIGILREQIQAGRTEGNALRHERDRGLLERASLVREIDLLRVEGKARVASLEEAAAARDLKITSLTLSVDSLVADRDSAQRELSQLRAVHRQLERDRADMEERTAREAARGEERRQQMSGTIDRLTRELAAIYRSRSWRATAPLRNFVRMVSGHGWREPGASVPVTIELPDPGSGIQTSAETGTRVPETTGPTTDSSSKRQYRILLVSYYCPTRAHAGGLRILDMYDQIKGNWPAVQLDLLTYNRPNIDWSLDDAYRIFDRVYLSPVEDLSPDVLGNLQGGAVESYDLVDLQFHQAGYQIDAFRRIGRRILFTPMESQARVLLIELRRGGVLEKGGMRRTGGLMNLAMEEVAFTRRADATVCVSRADAAVLRQAGGGRKVHSIETGLSQIEFAAALRPGFVPVPAENRRCSIVYVAYFNSETNVIALRWYLEKVHPLVLEKVPGYVLTVVGRGDLSSVERFRGPSVQFVGEVPTIAPYIADARVGIAPALSGSGFRGKVNQYAIVGVPCVLSKVALKGLAYADGVTALVADTPERFAQCCVDLLLDCSLNDRISTAARQLCIQRYSWQSKWKKIEAIYGLR